jgi:hypothetical protein
VSDGRNEFTGLVAVVPTRNRPDLAANAIASLLDARLSDLQVIVSDNSTTPADAAKLAGHCANLPARNISYVRPPEPLAMTAHWEWALRQAMERNPGASRFTFLTDRMMFRDGGLDEVAAIARAYPDRLVAYNHDRLVDDGRPVHIEEYAATSELLELQTSRVIWLYSRCFLFNAFPRMLNCIVPRAVLERISDRFGSVFASIAPDLAFCCRALHVETTYLFLDKSPLFHYALSHSHGAALARGEANAEAADFSSNLAAASVDAATRNYATPIPRLNTAHNAVINEYCVHREQTRDPRFGPIEMKRYLDINAWEIAEMADPRVRAEMYALLRAAGYEGPIGEPTPELVAQPRDDGRPTFSDAASAVAWARSHVMGGSQATRTFHEMLEGEPVPLPAI